MRRIKIEKNSNGSHDNNNPGFFLPLEEGWAIIPDEMNCTNYPFGDVTVEIIDGVPTVTKWVPLPMPEPEPVPEPAPTQLDRVEAQATYTAIMTDTLLEEG